MRLPNWRFGFLIAPLAALVSAGAYSRDENGFDLGGSLVPADEIHLGGPSRDGIPSIDRPKFVSGQAASFLEPASARFGTSSTVGT
jgi:hypothetical protein